MESVPAVYVGTVFVLFGAALLLWTGARVRGGAPVADGVSRVVGAALAGFFGCVSLAAGLWLLLRL